MLRSDPAGKSAILGFNVSTASFKFISLGVSAQYPTQSHNVADTKGLVNIRYPVIDADHQAVEGEQDLEEDAPGF